MAHAVVVSSDGLLIAASGKLARKRAEQLAVLSSGLISLAVGAAELFDGEGVRRTVVEMTRGHYLAMSIRDGSILAALASRGADIGTVGYEMTRLTKQAGELLTPALRTELHEALTVTRYGTRLR